MKENSYRLFKAIAIGVFLVVFACVGFLKAQNDRYYYRSQDDCVQRYDKWTGDYLNGYRGSDATWFWFKGKVQEKGNWVGPIPGTK